MLLIRAHEGFWLERNARLNIVTHDWRSCLLWHAAHIESAASMA